MVETKTRGQGKHRKTIRKDTGVATMWIITNWIAPAIVGLILSLILRAVGFDPLIVWVCAVGAIWMGVGVTNAIAWNKKRKREAQAWREHRERNAAR